jgi:hypothetical protein
MVAPVPEAARDTPTSGSSIRSDRLTTSADSSL